MHRIAHLTLASSVLGLLALFLALSMGEGLALATGAQSPALAAGIVIKVPDDYATIQAAVDVAVDGDTILVAGGLYPENLSISKGITLSGGWDSGFSFQIPGESVVDGQNAGRVVSITCASSATLVTIDGFTLQNGNATGLGGIAMTRGAFHGTAFTPTLAVADTLSPAEHAARLYARLDDVAARGLYPGGPAAYRAARAQVDRFVVQLEQARARSLERAADQVGQLANDCGGGIYSRNASLYLLNCTIQDNVASVTGTGCGGGVFVSQAALSGVTVEGNTIQRNMASVYADGMGGGLYLTQAPATAIVDNDIQENAGTNAGDVGLGGGVMVDWSPAALLLNNRVERNTANASWTGLFGLGGGAYVRGSNFSAVIGNLFRGNLAALHGGAGGGGLYLYDTQIASVFENRITENWACFTYADASTNGGGMGLDTLFDVQVTENAIWGNTASADTVEYEGGHGGGIWGALCVDTLVATNTITGNVGSHLAFGRGGGTFFIATEDLTVSGNTIADNVSTLSGDLTGLGGGLHLRNTQGNLIQGNRIQDNRASVDGPGSGGGLTVEGWGPYSFDVTVDANLILGNQASANPAFQSWGGGGEIHWTEGFTFTNNVVAGNTAAEGAGVELRMSRGRVVNNTVAENAGTGIQVDLGLPTGAITFVNNVVVSQTIGIMVGADATATVRYTLWDGNGTDIASAGTLVHTDPVTGSPAFVDPAGGDYHIAPHSMARDAGDPAGVPPAPGGDLDGDARPQGFRVDLGADEWRGYLLYLPLAIRG